MGKVISCIRITLSRDGMIRAGMHEIGEWEREGVAISFHYRPSGNERQWEYVARMHDDNHFCAPTMAELRKSIMEEYRDGIEIEVIPSINYSRVLLLVLFNYIFGSKSI